MPSGTSDTWAADRLWAFSDQDKFTEDELEDAYYADLAPGHDEVHSA